NNANSKFKDAVTILENNNQDKNLMLLSKTYEVLALSSAKSGNNEEAYVALLKHNSYKDRFLNDIKVKSDIVTKAKFEIEDYKNDAHLSNIAKLEQEVANSEIKILNLIISVILLLVFVVSITLYI